MTIRKAFKYRLYPNKTTTAKLQWVLSRCRELYNAGLQERRDAYEATVRRHPNYFDEVLRKQVQSAQAISYYDQQNDLPEIKSEIRPEYQDIAAHVLQDVLRRLDRAFKAFFRRIEEGKTPGYPRFQGRNRYDSFTYPDGAGWKVKSDPDSRKGYLTLTKIGTIRVKLHRKIEGTIKTVTIKHEGEQWFVVFSCEMEKPEALPVSYEDVGIDLGVTHFAALSNGEFIESPGHYRKAEKKLKKMQESLSHKKRGSHRRARAVKRIAKAHRKIRNQRRDFAHKASRQLTNQYQVIMLEKLQTANLTRRPKPKQDEATGQYLPNGASAKSGLNKSINDAGWAMFIELLKVKAAWAGRKVVFVNPYKTSRICSGCGREVKKDLSERWHRCECGTELDRDTNAALNILKLGYKHLLGGTRPTSATA